MAHASFWSRSKTLRIGKKVLSPTNVGALPVVNQAVGETTAELLGLSQRIFRLLPVGRAYWALLMPTYPRLDRVACWHLGRDRFDYERARHKIQTFGRHRILRHPWTNGGGLTKTKALREVGLFKPDEGESAYWVRVALAGYVVGYYYPPVPVEHMDYPWSPHFPYKGRFEEWARTSGSPKRLGFENFDDAKTYQQYVLRPILDGPWEAKSYIGWRGKLGRIRTRLRRTLLRAKW